MVRYYALATTCIAFGCLFYFIIQSFYLHGTMRSYRRLDLIQQPSFERLRLDCSAYSFDDRLRATGSAANCSGIPALFCDNVTAALGCTSVAQRATRPVLCEVHKSVRGGVDNSSAYNCTPSQVVYTCKSMNQSNLPLPCLADFVIDEYDYHTQFYCIQRIAAMLGTASRHKVPPIHHQVWYYDKARELQFHEYIGLISHLRFFRPEAMFIWNNGMLPTGRWMEEFISHLNQPTGGEKIYLKESFASSSSFASQLVFRYFELFNTKLISIRRNPPDAIYGTKIKHIQHKGDVTRLEALLLFGGFYADTDTVSLRSPEPLLNSSVTMGLEGQTSLTNQAIYAEPHAPHLYSWHISYASFEPGAWSEWSIQRNYRIAKRCPGFVNIQETTMASPNWDNRRQHYTTDVDKSASYTTHLYWRYIEHRGLESPAGVMNYSYLAHRVFRNIYLGLCKVCG